MQKGGVATPSTICFLFCPRLKHFVFVDCRIYDTKRNTVKADKLEYIYIYIIVYAMYNSLVCNIRARLPNMIG